MVKLKNQKKNQNHDCLWSEEVYRVEIDRVVAQRNFLGSS